MCIRDSAVTTSDGPVMELTPASGNQAGSAFTSNHIVLDPNDGFGTFFMFRMSKPGNTPAGGITFTIQNASSTSLGGSGSGLGYSGISNSLSVGFGAKNNVSVSTPAGGITFTIQNASSTSLGGSGSGLGYSGISNSLSVGFGAKNNVSVSTNG